MLLNYRSERSFIEIKSDIKKKPGANNTGDSMVFSSPGILKNFFKNSNIYFHLKKQKIKIENLFSMPKN